MAFEVITQGPANPSGQTPQAAPNGLCLDQQNNIFTTVGSAGTESAPLQRLATYQEQTALTAITTAQNFFSLALKAYLLNRLNRTVRITGRAIYTSPGTTTPTITIALVLGTTTLVTITSAALSATATTNGQIEFEFAISTQATGSSAAAIEAHGDLGMNIGANALGAALAYYADQNTAVVGSLNLTAALALKVTIAASSAITSAQLLFATVDVVGA